MCLFDCNVSTRCSAFPHGDNSDDLNKEVKITNNGSVRVQPLFVCSLESMILLQHRFMILVNTILTISTVSPNLKMIIQGRD